MEGGLDGLWKVIRTLFGTPITQIFLYSELKKGFLITLNHVNLVWLNISCGIDPASFTSGLSNSELKGESNDVDHFFSIT